jgi:hypothetical protein
VTGEGAGAAEAEAQVEAGAAPVTATEVTESEPEEQEGPPAPPAPPPGPGDWYVVVEADQEWFERNEAEGTAGAVSFPTDVAPWQLTLTGDEVLIGRRSETRTAQPDMEIEDPGVSRRHAVLRKQSDGTWSIVDEQSTNGTWIDRAVDPIVAGEPEALNDGSIVHIGAFTRLTIRRA